MLTLSLLLFLSVYRFIEGYIKDDADTDETRTLDNTSVRQRFTNDGIFPKFSQGAGVLPSESSSLYNKNPRNHSLEWPVSTGTSSNQGDPRKKVVINFAEHYN